MKIMAVDYGDVRTGIAISDITRTITGKTLVITSYKAEDTADKITELVKSEGIGEIVLGYPKNMNATIGERAEKSSAFAVLLEKKTGIRPVLWDERRTTVDAHRILTENNKRGKKRKSIVDAVAASLILEAYLEYIKLRD